MKITNSKIEKLREQLRLEEKKKNYVSSRNRKTRLSMIKDKAYKAYLMIKEKCESNPTFKADFREFLINNFKDDDFKIVHFYVLMKEKKMTTLPISQSDLDEINKDLADDGVIYDLDTSGIDIEAVDPEIDSDD